MTLRSVVAILALLLWALPAHAQFDSATVSGVVQDTTRAVLPGADVTLVSVGTSQERRTVTNDRGAFTFPNVPVGEYRVVAAISGFRSVTKTGVTVNAGINIRVDFELALGGLTETVQVEAATTLVDTATIARSVRAEQIQETALSGRRVTQVAQFVPGTVGQNMGNFATMTGTFATGITSINGGRSDEFMATVDGAPSIRVRAAGGFTMGMQNLDTVEEVQVLTTNYQAEYGRSSAGQLRLVTKSGGQSFRGNVFWSFQNDSLNANSWTRNRSGLPKVPHNYNASGFTLGGPIYIPGRFNASRQKLFFFWGEEWVRYRSVENQQGIVPTAAMRNGDFSELLNPANPFFRRVRIIRDPLTGLPFPGNVIPQNRLSPNGRALLNAYPLPIPGFQQGANNWIGAPRTFNDTRKDSIKIDWVPNGSHRLAARHTWAPNIWNDPEPVEAYSTIWDYPGRTAAATLTSTLSSSLINEFTFSWGSTKPSKFFGQRNCDYCSGGPDLVPYRLRSQTGLDYPYIFPGTKLDPEKISNVSMQGFTAINNAAYPGSWHDFVFLYTDNVTKIAGNHSVKVGLSVERSGMDDQIQLSFAQAPATTNQNGSFRFNDTTRTDGSTLSAANVILGLFDDYTEFGAKPLTKWKAMAYDVYAQDSWKATRSLTVELGLRYSYWQPWGVNSNEMASFDSAFYDPARAAMIDPRTGAVLGGDRFNGIVLPGDGPSADTLAKFPQLAGLQHLYRGVPNGFAETPKDGFQPRLGMAYAIGDRMTFRSGIGMFLNRVQINTTAAYGLTPPLSEMVTVINGNVDAPAGAERRVFPLVMAMQSPEFTNPRSWAWNATVDRELPWSMRTQVSYVGRSASNLEGARNVNQLEVGTIQRNRLVNPNALRPFKGFGSITLYETKYKAKYNSLQVQVERRSTRNVGFSLAYTLSRNKDNSNGRGDILPPLIDEGIYYALSSFDRPHVFISQARYRVPSFDGMPAAVGWVLGNWDLSGVLQAQSGTPFSVRTGVDIAGVGPGSGQQFWDQVGDPSTGTTEFDGTRAVWFNRAAFSAPAAGTLAQNPVRNALRQPGFWDLHLALRKAVPVGTQRFELRWEIFNVLNHTNLGNASTNPNGGDFGTITSKTGNRTMQIGLNYVF